jgi:hypothetical protein
MKTTRSQWTGTKPSRNDRNPDIQKTPPHSVAGEFKEP